MNYNVIRYFSQHKASQGRKIQEFYFKHKAAGGWPGNVRIVYEDGSITDLPNTERTKVKDCFSCERCLYCLDKLNHNSDISVGDNYIKKNADIEGVSSVIVRTECGQKIWKMCRDNFSWHIDLPEELMQAQVIGSKKVNYEFAKIKGLYGSGAIYDSAVVKRYKEALKKMEQGRSDDVYRIISTQNKNRRFTLLVKKLKRKIQNISIQD